MQLQNNRQRYLLEALPYEGQLRACLLRLTRDRSAVPDLLQETWLRLLIAGNGDSAIECVQAYALSVARNVARDWLRRKKVVAIELVEDVDRLSVTDDSNPQQPERLVSGRQELERLAEIAAAMPRRRQAVFCLRKVYEMSQREIAEHLGIAEHTVEQHLRAAARDVAAGLLQDAQPPPATGLFKRLRYLASKTR